ncbi:hypothetical protein BBM40_16115 [Vibrio parahaemolyticus]|uniref:hypothetical protein n=1 Tax=Vibrio harveyi group TaxID=717610 RepID=UPI00071F1A65|nr:MULTISPECIES: hypothetical protein [Vibrio harveyi group]ALR91150.1 hypothetical protein AT730_01640 [Vibrio alginolyticus]MBY7707815.1 hypothetical protein [Vibrio alginolyticus]ODZ47866.1 hypothetical protein BBM40_16115 [Vibrio parahaemolyticus]HCG7966437.1 hypothetical protein [Vibrio parahaemolyticus]
MEIKSIEYVTKIMIEYHDSEREKTKNWITNNDYELVSEVQLSSKSYTGQAEKKVKLEIVEHDQCGANQLDVAKEFIESKLPNRLSSRVNMASGVEVDTELQEYPKAIEFRVFSSIYNIRVYMRNINNQYKVTAWSEHI